MDSEKRDILLRLKRIEGQVRGLAGMIERGSPCLDVLAQVGAVRAAMKRVGALVLQAHMEECLSREASGERELRESLKDFQRALSRYINCS